MSALHDLEKQLKRESQKRNRLELNLSYKKEKLRKFLVRKKIQLGELVILANLQEERPETILGLLADGKKKLDAKDVRENYSNQGKQLLDSSKKG